MSEQQTATQSNTAPISAPNSGGMLLFGRKTIYTDVEKITRENVVKVLKDALQIHEINRRHINYLHHYYKGRQPILNRTKDVQNGICNKVVENRANEIVSFKKGYLMGEPVQYINRSEEKENSEAINQINDFVHLDDKAKKDMLLSEWFYKCGVAYKFVMPNEKYDKTSVDESPFNTYILDPRNAFVIRRNDLTNRVIAGVKYVTRKDSKVVYSVYTDKEYFEIEEDEIIDTDTHECGNVPIIEYAANTDKLGAFEIVLPLLDAINIIDSNRVDGVEQFIQALLMFKGVDIKADEFKLLKDLGAIKVPLEGDIKYLIQELNQQQTQTLKDDMYETVITICGMPNRNGGSSTSDTGRAVIMRDGWSAAEARAKEAETMYKSAEKEALKIILHICRTMGNVNIKLSSIDIRFTRRNYENILEKAQVLTTMLNCDKIHPSLAFQSCGMFIDSELAWTISKDYYEKLATQAAEDGGGQNNAA